MIVKCEDVFVDSLTGEIINPLDYCLPEGYDVSPAVTEALTGLPLKGTYTTTGEIKKGKGRKPKVLVNKYCSLFQNLERKDVRTTTGEIKSVAILPSVIDDVVTGALRLNEGGDNTTVPRNQLLFVLAHLETLSVESIQSLFTAKRELKGDAAPRITQCMHSRSTGQTLRDLRELLSVTLDTIIVVEFEGEQTRLNYGGRSAEDVIAMLKALHLEGRKAWLEVE